jgi:excisionase family DNA binding protein
MEANAMETMVMVKELPPEWAELPPVLNTTQVSKLLDVHINTVSNLLERGDLKGFKVGRVWRVHRDDLLKYVGLANGEEEQKRGGS